MYISIENLSTLILPPWASVTVELLNQLEDKNHHCRRLQLGARNDKFIAHSVLGYNPTTNCQYLKDDKLYFIISLTTNYPPSNYTKKFCPLLHTQNTILRTYYNILHV